MTGHMSTVHPTKRVKRTITQLSVAILLVVPLLRTSYLYYPSQSSPISSIPSNTTPQKATLTSEEDDEKNSQQVKQYRKTLSKQCRDATSEEEVQSIFIQTKQMFQVPPPPSTLNSTTATTAIKQQPRSPTEATKRCNLVILDFGANIGDTAGHAIDAGLFTCHRDDLFHNGRHPNNNNQARFNITSGTLYEGRRNAVSNGIQHLMTELNNEYNTEYSIEDYCYYGIEGNPVFTSRLQSLEDGIMSMTPRPLKHLHFYTESVGAGKVGMTKLYLDTVNTRQNFWGSSIYKDHGDVKKSAFQNPDSKIVEADVMGYTITELLLMTTRQLNPEYVDEEERRGGHVLIKVDIEGGEYPLLIEAADSGILCQFIELGNRVDLFIEFHSERVTGSNPLVKKIGGAKAKLTSCGVEFRNLVANWH